MQRFVAKLSFYFTHSMPLMLLLFLALPVFSAISGESRYPSLSQDGGTKGNPAGLSAYESSGLIFSYEKIQESMTNVNNFLFGFWGNNYGASFNWTKGKNGYDKSLWSLVDNEYNVSRSLFFGNRFSATRISQEQGTAFSWTPGFILRPISLLSFGFWSEQALQYGFYQNRMQNAGISVRPYNGITASWSVAVKNYEQLKNFFSQTEQNLLLELDAFAMTFGLEFPLVNPNNTGEFRLSLSAVLSPHYNSTIAFAANNFDDDMNFKKFSLIRHSALNQESLRHINIIYVPLENISEKNNGWSLFGREQSGLEILRNTF
jgi:protease-4